MAAVFGADVYRNSTDGSDLGKSSGKAESGLDVYETTRDQVRRALESAGIVLLSTDKGEGVLRLHEPGSSSPRL